MEVVGRAGSGKTEWLKLAATSLVYYNTSAEVRLAILATDASAAHYEFLHGQPHLIAPVGHNAQGPEDLLVWLADEVSRRAAEFARCRALSFGDYIREVGLENAIPRVVVIVDDLLHLPFENGHRLESRDYLEPLAAMGHICGIHLVMAARSPLVQSEAPSIRRNCLASICLGVETPELSAMILGDGKVEAATISPEACGRAYLRLQENPDVVELQLYFAPPEQRAAMLAARCRIDQSLSVITE